jgi:UDP-N-acetylmuramoyl-L-alanyl-D-glutamate--2,6-diaminopimelate ligase
MLHKTHNIGGRRLAIHFALEMANHADIVLLLGRGDEKFQNINGELIPLQDADVAREWMRTKVCNSSQ